MPTSKPISIFIWRSPKLRPTRIILSLIDSIVGLLREQRLRIFRVSGGPERGQIHHKRILDAVERHDAEKAREAMRAHLARFAKTVSRRQRSVSRARAQSHDSGR